MYCIKYKIISLLSIIYIYSAIYAKSTDLTFPVKDTDLSKLLERYPQFQDYGNLIESILLPVLGKRAFYNHPPLVADNALEWHLHDRVFRIQFNGFEGKPFIFEQDYTYTLSIPRQFDLAQITDSITALFRSTILDRFIVNDRILEERESHGEGFVLKPEQLDAIEFISNFVNSKDRTALVVASTGLGKSHIIYRALSNILYKDPNAMIVVVTDTRNIINQLSRGYSRFEPNIKVATKHGKSKQTLQEQKNAQVLFITRQSLMTSAGKNLLNQENRNVYLMYDEAHHLGSDQFFKWINQKKQSHIR